jgi:hypothetical protein
MTINWGALGVVAAVSLVVGVLVVVLVSFVLVGLSAREPGPTVEQTDESLVTDRVRSGLSRAAGTAIAAICLLGTAATVLYGLYVIAL